MTLHTVTCSARIPGLRAPLAIAVAVAIGAVVGGCNQSAEIGPIDIRPVDVAGPPAGWDMSTRLMNRQSASTATVSGTTRDTTADFTRISGSMYYNDGHDEPFTGTVVMRADSLTGDDAALLRQLTAWLEPDRYPAFIFQSTTSAVADGGFRVDGNLFVRDRVVPATGRWRFLEPLAIGEDLRKSAVLAASVSATAPGAPFPGGELRIELMLPVVSYTAPFVRNLLESDGIDVDALAAPNPTYPTSPGDLSNVAWYLMLAGRTGQALDVFQMSLDKSAILNTYLRRSDGYVFDGQYDMAVGSYTALEPYNVGQPHGLELVKILGGKPLDPSKVAEINRVLADR